MTSNVLLRDRDIRSALIVELSRLHSHDGSQIINELGLLQGKTRVDVAVVNGEISGYEIKSAADSLIRLPRQQELYSQVLHRAWIVTTEKRAEELQSIVPEWWGVLVATNRKREQQIQLDHLRDAKRNPAQNSFAIAQLLWRNEALNLLVDAGAEKGVKSKPRADIWRRLTETYPLDELCSLVCSVLKSRKNWRRVDPLQSQCGAKSPGAATLLESLIFPQLNTD
jgi:hypothetical protein